MNRRAFIKGLLTTCAAVAVPVPSPAYATGGWFAGIDLANASDMLSVGYMRDTLTGAFEIIEVSLIDNSKRGDLLRINSLLRRDVERLSSTSAGESEPAVTRASRRAEDLSMRGAA